MFVHCIPDPCPKRTNVFGRSITEYGSFRTIWVIAVGASADAFFLIWYHPVVRLSYRYAKLQIPYIARHTINAPYSHAQCDRAAAKTRALHVRMLAYAFIRPHARAAPCVACMALRALGCARARAYVPPREA